MTTRGMKITGIEADLLLYALDAYLGVNAQGELQRKPPHRGHTKRAAQDLRDRLFHNHEHPSSKVFK